MKIDEIINVLGHPLLILIAGDPKTGKTVSASTFPKPMKFLDFDGGFASVIFKGIDTSGIDVVPLNYRADLLTVDLAYEDVKKMPEYYQTAVDVYSKFNSELASITDKYETVVIDSLTSFFRVARDAYIKINNIVPPRLRIQDYGSFDHIVYSRLFPALRRLPVKFVVLISHIDIEKDEVTGAISEFPTAISRNMGRALAKECDEVWRQIVSGNEYIWKTRNYKFFQGGSRLSLPDTVPATYESLRSKLE